MEFKKWDIATATMPNWDTFDVIIYDIRDDIIVIKIINWNNEWKYSYIFKSELDETLKLKEN